MRNLNAFTFVPKAAVPEFTLPVKKRRSPPELLVPIAKSCEPLSEY